jgi:hypothetical protein
MSSAPIFATNDWKVDFPPQWHETSSPETTPGSDQSVYAGLIANAPDMLTFMLAKPDSEPQAGARALYDPNQNRGWMAFANCYDKTVRFSDTWYFPTELANYYGEDGFLTAGWQFKNDPAAGANAGMAMNLHTFRGEGMRWWLQNNTWETRAQDDTFPIIPVGQPVETELLLHFHDDPTLGWMELHYAGAVLRIVGANMGSNYECGAYICLYGTCNGTMINQRTRIERTE